MPKKITNKRPIIRRRRHIKRKKTPRWMRILLGIVVFITAGFCVKAVVCKVAKPYLISHSESQEIEELQKQIALATAENIQLKKETELMTTPQGKEAEARKLGWVKNGEVALVVEQPDHSKLMREQAQAAMKETFWQSAGKKLVGIFARSNSAH